jgi:diaminopimelate epimerase
MASRSPPRHFDKYEGLGNDFIVIDVEDGAALEVDRAVRLCDRRRGVGADGVLMLSPARSGAAAARMSVINADGSIPEMCGNGLRCVALHLARRGGPRAFVVETDAGARACSIEGISVGSDGSIESFVTVAMGRVVVGGHQRVDVEGQPVDLWLASAGNPHAVLFGVSDRDSVNRLGPRIATHSAFPQGTNVGFATTHDGRVDLVVWERGVGLTLACGTGACAAVAVGVERGLLPAGAPVDVSLPGGSLRVTRDPLSGETTLRGPARHVFRGELDGA